MTAITCVHWKPDVKNGRQGFADLALPDAGIIIRGVVLNASHSKRWISWPAVATGKGFAPCFQFLADTDRAEWQSSAVAAIDRFISGLDAERGGDLPLMP
jgi:hypothetical protein